MVNRPKVVGTTWESAVVAFLREHGFEQAERRALSGGLDKGDIINAGPYVWEAKNTKSIDLAGGMDELKQEVANCGPTAGYGFLIVKRRRKSTGEGYAVMTLSQLCDILERLPDGQ